MFNFEGLIGSEKGPFESPLKQILSDPPLETLFKNFEKYYEKKLSDQKKVTNVVENLTYLAAIFFFLTKSQKFRFQGQKTHDYFFR